MTSAQVDDAVGGVRATIALRFAVASVLVTVVFAVLAAFAVPIWVVVLPGLALAARAIVVGREALAATLSGAARKRARTAITIAGVFIGYVMFQLAGLLFLSVTHRL